MYNHNDLDTDFREVDLKKVEDQQMLTSMIRERIEYDRAENEQEKVHWKKFQQYYDNNQTLAGITDDAAEVFTHLNLSPTLIDKDGMDAIFLAVNEFRQIIDGTVSEYTDVHKVSKCTSKDPRQKKAAEIANKVIVNVETSQKLWTRVHKPNIKKQTLLCCSWADVEYNNRVDFPLGRITVEALDPRDVWPDKEVSKDFFDDMRWVTKMFKMTLKEAKRFVRRKGGDPSSISSDGVYDQYHDERANTKGDKGEYVTFYKHQWKEVYPCYYMPGEDGSLEQIYRQDGQTEDEFYDFIQANEVIEQEDEVYFIAYYHESIGCFSCEVNKLGMWTLSVCYNIHSDTKTYPNADSFYIIKLAVIYNILNTMIFDKFRKNSREIIEVDEDLYKEYELVFANTYSMGGIMPKKRGSSANVLTRSSLDESSIVMLDRIKQYLKDAGYRQEPSDGNYPKDRLATKTVNALIAQGRRKSTYKDDNIALYAERINTIIYKIVATEFTAPHYIKLNEEKPGLPNFAPINEVLTLQEYQSLLQQYKVMPEVFEEENDVNYIIPKIQLPVEVAQQMTYVVINPLDDELEMTVEVEFEFDAERDESERIEKTMIVRKEGLMPDDDFLKGFGYGDNEVTEMLKKVYEKNEVMQIGEAVLKAGPEVIKQVQDILQANAVNNQNNKPGQGQQQNPNQQ